MTRDQLYARGRHGVSFVGGILLAVGFMKQVDLDSLLKALDQINDAAATIMKIVGPLATLAAGIVAGRSASPAAQVQKALSIDPTTVINHAIMQQPVEAISAVAELPQVRQVVTDAATANESTSVFVKSENSL